MEMHDYQKKTIKSLRGRFPELGKYLDEEIISAYTVYCGLFYAATWTDVSGADFVKWATTAPIDEAR